MNLKQLEVLIATGNVPKLKTSIETCAIISGVKDSLKQFEPGSHIVKDKLLRKDKVIYKETPASDLSGLVTKVIDHYIPVARLPLPLQKKIVRTAVRFLGSPEIIANIEDDAQQEFFNLLNKVFKDNKLHYRFREISRITMSEKHCAELWYLEQAPEGYWNDALQSGFKLRTRILAESKGDNLYPVFDEYEDMVAFARCYNSETINLITGAKIKVEHMDLYTAERIYEFRKESAKGSSNIWQVNKDETVLDETNLDNNYTGDGLDGRPNPFNKIPVIYYSQPETEWSDVQDLIDRLEIKTSNHADTNDYYDSPIVVASGEVTGFANKGEQGKILQAENGAKVDYLTWDNAPASMEMEIKNLWNYIHTFTSTPDLSFENLKGLGYFSTIALETMFMDAHMKASEKEEIFGEGVQRRINLVTAMLAALDPQKKEVSKLLDAYPLFTFYLPRNKGDEINEIKSAIDAGILSKKTGISINPLVQDIEQETANLEQEAINTNAVGGGR